MYYSADLKKMFEFMSYSNFQTPFDSYIQKLFDYGLKVSNVPVSTRFEEIGFPAKSIVANSVDKVLVFILMMVTAISLLVLIAL